MSTSTSPYIALIFISFSGRRIQSLAPSFFYSPLAESLADKPEASERWGDTGIEEMRSRRGNQSARVQSRAIQAGMERTGIGAGAE